MSANGQDIASLYLDHHGWLRGWLRQRLRCSETAADLAHDTFMRLLVSKAPRRFEAVAAARQYLRVTAENLCINLWRRQEIERAWRESLEEQPLLAPSAEQQAAVLRVLEEINRLLQALPARTSQAFLLAVVCQQSDDAAGAQLGISGRMVRKHVARAMLSCMSLAPAARALHDD